MKSETGKLVVSANISAELSSEPGKRGKKGKLQDGTERAQQKNWTPTASCLGQLYPIQYDENRRQKAFSLMI